MVVDVRDYSFRLLLGSGSRPSRKRKAPAHLSDYEVQLKAAYDGELVFVQRPDADLSDIELSDIEN